MTNKFDSKRFFWILLNTTLVVMIVGLLFGAKTLKRYAASLAPVRVITVSGEGKVTVVPDIAVVSFSVVSEGANPVDVQRDNTEKTNKALAFVKEQGIDAKDFKTTQYSLAPIYE